MKKPCDCLYKDKCQLPIVITNCSIGTKEIVRKEIEENVEGKR